LIQLFSFISVFLGWLIQGFIGFGSSIVSTSILVLIFDVKEVIVSLSITALVGTTLLAISTYKGKWYLKESIAILTLSFIGAFIGSFLLEYLNITFVELIFGIVVLFTGIYDFLFQKGIIKQILIRNKTLFLIFTGVFGGVMSGLIGASGPIHVLYFNQVLKDKEHFKFVVSFIFSVLNVERIIFYLYSENLRELFNLDIILWGIPATVLGMYIGHKLSLKLPVKVFKEIVSVAIILTGIVFILKSLGEIL